MNWEILANALRDDSKLFHSLTQKGLKLLANRLVRELISSTLLFRKFGGFARARFIGALKYSRVHSFTIL